VRDLYMRLVQPRMPISPQKKVGKPRPCKEAQVGRPRISANRRQLMLRKIRIRRERRVGATCNCEGQLAMSTH
jgi:hypothetical protein